MVVLVAVKVVGVVLLFDPASATPFEGPKSVFSLAIASLLAAAVGLSLFRIGPRELLRSRLHLVVGVFVVASLLAAAFARDHYVAIFGAQRRLGLTFVLDMVVLYLAVAIAYRTRRDWGILGGAVAGAGALAMVYGLGQSLGLDPIPWADDVRARPPSTFGNPDKFGHFLCVTFAAALAVAVLPGSDRTRRVRAVAGSYAAAALGMAAIVATRGTVIGLAAAAPALGILYLTLTRGRRLSSTILIGAGGVFTLLALSTLVALATPLGERVRAGFTDIASQQRLILADTAIRAFTDRPLT